MSKKQEFIKYVEMAIEAYPQEMPEDARVYWDALRSKEEVEKPMFTDNGKLIVKFLQDNQNVPMWKSKDIAEGLFISSRGVAGAMRKLVTDDFVEKIGQDPCTYALTEKGKNVVIED